MSILQASSDGNYKAIVQNRISMFTLPHKILAKTIGEMSVYILGYTNAIIQWMIVLGYNTLLNVRFKLYLAKNVHCTFS